MDEFNESNGVKVRAYKGDAMTLLAFDLDKGLCENFVGFTIRIKAGDRDYYLYNRLSFETAILKLNQIDLKEQKSTLFSPIQKFRWVHVPSTQHFLENPYFGNYTYEVTPRYMENKILKPIDPSLTASVTIAVEPFRKGALQIGFTRAFISSQAYAERFANQGKLRPNKTDLVFDVKMKSGQADRWNAQTKKYEVTEFTFEEQHEYLGWQARDRIMEFLDEVIQDPALNLDAFVYDLDEPVIVGKLLQLAKEGRIRIIADDSGKHGKEDSMEGQFASLFKKEARNANALFRGHFQALSHAKVFIQKRGTVAIKVLTGSTNFTTNGMYINANHVLLFNNASVAGLYEQVFEASFGAGAMSAFKDQKLAKQDFSFGGSDLPVLTIRFSPHPKEVADQFFSSISHRISNAASDVLFAIMDDDSKSSILDAVRSQVESDNVFTYGITDNTSRTLLYKPDRIRGIKVAGKGTETALPPPFNKVAEIPGHNIHHKFIVVDFKGTEPVVYCGSSNLAYGPEQNNGDNLLEIHDPDIVTAFAIEAIRLVDHFQWRQKTESTQKKQEPLTLSDGSEEKKPWHAQYYSPKDLHCLERTLLVK
jgi:hypothetical protein